jgi:hypothetical protein
MKDGLPLANGLIGKLNAAKKDEGIGNGAIVSPKGIINKNPTVTNA